MKFIDVSNAIYNFIVKTVLGGILKNAFLVFLVKKLVDYFAKPVYDWAIRKGYMAVKTTKAKESQDNLNKSKTKSEIEVAIDEMP